jgi:hypothetical protein
MLQEVFGSLAAHSKFTGRFESHFGPSATQKLLKQVTQPLSEPGEGGGSSYTFGYRRMAEIFNNNNPHSNIQYF